MRETWIAFSIIENFVFYNKKTLSANDAHFVFLVRKPIVIKQARNNNTYN